MSHNQHKPIAIIGAMPIELAWLQRQLTATEVKNHFGLAFHTGRLGDKRVVVVVGGVGLVNSAAATALLIERFQPAAIVFTGVAGGLGDVRPGDVVIGEKTVQYDFGQLERTGMTMWETFQPSFSDRNPLFFPADADLLKVAQGVATQVKLPTLAYDELTYRPKIVTGIIATKNFFSADGAYNAHIQDQTGCIALEMEGAAVAQICFQQDVPCLVIRSISNMANETNETGLAVYRQLKKPTAENAQRLVAEMVAMVDLV